MENPPARAKAMLYWYPVWCHSLVDWELLNADSRWIALLEDDLTMALVLQGATHRRLTYESRLNGLTLGIRERLIRRGCMLDSGPAGTSWLRNSRVSPRVQNQWRRSTHEPCLWMGTPGAPALPRNPMPWLHERVSHCGQAQDSLAEIGGVPTIISGFSPQLCSHLFKPH